MAGGVWRYSGMAGVITGLDITDALARVGDGDNLDRDAMTGFLKAIEEGAIEASLARHKKAQEQ